MNSNFEWQKTHTLERIHERMSEAESHRMAKQGSPLKAKSFISFFKKIFVALKSLVTSKPNYHAHDTQEVEIFRIKI